MATGIMRRGSRWVGLPEDHLLLLRTRVLNDDLAAEFQRWHPALALQHHQPTCNGPHNPPQLFFLVATKSLELLARVGTG